MYVRGVIRGVFLVICVFFGPDQLLISFDFLFSAALVLDFLDRAPADSRLWGGVRGKGSRGVGEGSRDAHLLPF